MVEYSDDLVRRCQEAAEAVPHFWTRVDPSAGLDAMFQVGWDIDGREVVIVGCGNRQEARVIRDVLEERARIRAVLLAAGHREDTGSA